eukprot:5196122-Prymnesium_polylepis.2
MFGRERLTHHCGRAVDALRRLVHQRRAARAERRQQAESEARVACVGREGRLRVEDRRHVVDMDVVGVVRGRGTDRHEQVERLSLKRPQVGPAELAEREGATRARVVARWYGRARVLLPRVVLPLHCNSRGGERHVREARLLAAARLTLRGACAGQ